MPTPPDRPTFDLPSPAAPRGPIPRQVPPGTVPMLAVEGTAYDCGREYGELVRERYPFYTNYRERRAWWTELAPEVRTLYEQRAPHLFDLLQGLSDGIGPHPPCRRQRPPPLRLRRAALPSAFPAALPSTASRSPARPKTRRPTAPTATSCCGCELRTRPTILVLAYPGEVLGYGMWSTGMSIFRNSLYSQAGAEQGATDGHLGPAHAGRIIGVRRPRPRPALWRCQFR